MGHLFAALLLCWLPLVSAHAGIADAPGDRLEIAVLTYGPGAIYWERFGHDAIEIRDLASGESMAFNYGLFDFNQDNFLLKFATGHMYYRIDALATARDLAWYAGEGRSVRRQQLDLSPAQRAALRDHLLWNLRPENAQYRYRYYTANCATKVRDALDLALHGALKTQLQAQAVDTTWREQTRRLMAPQPALMLLIDLGLAGRADQPLNAWQASFLPGTLASHLAEVRIGGSATTARPLVTADTVLIRARLPAPPAQAPDLRVPLLVAGALLALLLVLTGRGGSAWARRLFASLGTLWLAAAGLAGLLMLLLWGATAHEVAWANANLLLFNPLAWLLIPALWRHARRARDELIAWLLILLPAAGLLANLTGLIAQRNLAWILLALPVWLALSYVLRQHARPAATTVNPAGASR